MLDRFRGYLDRATEAFDGLIRREEELPQNTDAKEDAETEDDDDEYVRKMREEFSDIFKHGLL